MENKFGRVKAFVDELEKVELVENEEIVSVTGTIVTVTLYLDVAVEVERDANSTNLMTKVLPL